MSRNGLQESLEEFAGRNGVQPHVARFAWRAQGLFFLGAQPYPSADALRIAPGVAVPVRKPYGPGLLTPADVIEVEPTAEAAPMAETAITTRGHW